jgi:hypothetical protein
MCQSSLTSISIIRALEAADAGGPSDHINNDQMRMMLAGMGFSLF